MRLLFDYLFWLLQEKEGNRIEKWFASDSGDYISVEKMDKYLFLKYGDEQVNECLDLEAAFNCLYELILKGNDTLTYSRLEFIRKRMEGDPFKLLEVDVVEEEQFASEEQPEVEPEESVNEVIADELEETIETAEETVVEDDNDDQLSESTTDETLSENTATFEEESASEESGTTEEETVDESEVVEETKKRKKRNKKKEKSNTEE